MIRRSFLAIGIVVLLCVATLAPAAPRLTVVWNDAYGLFPRAALGKLSQEVERLFADNGMSVRLHALRSDENLMTIPAPRVNVIVMPSDGSSWGAGSEAMAATIGKKGGAHNIFVFYPSVLLSLGRSSTELSPRDLAELGRAMARIVGHELIHVLAPERGHASSGLMSAVLKRRDLLKKKITLDASSLRLAKFRLESWGRTGEAVVARHDAVEGRRMKPCLTLVVPLDPRI